MNIRTTNDLCSFISADLAWRKKELSTLINYSTGTSTNSIDQLVLTRCGVALLYAHWEGFIKIATNAYLAFLKMQRLRNDQIKPNLLTLSMLHSVNFSSESNKYSEYGKITDFYLLNMTSHARFPFKNGLDTKSNLSSTVLKEFLWCLGLDYSPYETKEKLIDTRLVNRRNHIAHGQYLDIGIEDFKEMRDSIIVILESIKTEIENSAINGSYKKKYKVGTYK
ncbi:MAG: hypothetical protein JW976_15340 [Syntrophaceae bacterium]|nr:hypothetical protein [Syntrophaceae bacterium]